MHRTALCPTQNRSYGFVNRQYRQADETLEFLDSRGSLAEQHVRGGDLAVHLKQRADKEARLAKVLEGARQAFSA